MNIKHLAEIAANRKNIPLEQAENEINEIVTNKTAYMADLALRHYLEDQTNKTHVQATEDEEYTVDSHKE